MDNNKSVSDSAAAGSSGSGNGRKALKKLKALNAKLMMEIDEHRKEVAQLQQLLAAATERLASSSTDLNALEMRRLCVVEETDEKKKELRDLEEKLQAREEQGDRRWKKWLYPAAAAATTVCIAGALVTLCSKGSFTRIRN